MRAAAQPTATHQVVGARAAAGVTTLPMVARELAEDWAIHPVFEQAAASPQDRPTCAFTPTRMCAQVSAQAETSTPCDRPVSSLGSPQRR
jgi:hypothetical protein